MNSPNMYSKRITVLALIACFISILALVAEDINTPVVRFHTDLELAAFSKLSSAPIGAGDYFLTSAHCRSCHGYDSLNYANIDSNGVDINLFDDWQSTMMANSAKDPFWRAKVSHEVLVNPSHTLELQDNCTSCHAPMGNYTSKYKGLAAHYTLGALLADSLGLDGVSCAGCHTIADSARLGSIFSGIIPFDTTRNIYGPYTFPMAGPMQIPTGYTPKYSAHLNQSKACSPCHTLINKTVDLSGNYTGTSFVEQATYQEWLNSAYPGNVVTCQKCHMPSVTSGVVIANNNPSVPYRSPYSQHTFVGGNTFMLGLMKQNKAKLGITAADRNFDSTLYATNELLKTKTLEIALQLDSLNWDTAYFNVSLSNKAGHKFPSGYPSRRAVVQFVVKNSNNDTVFKSGIFNSDYTVAGESSGFEPHKNIIRQNNQSQIYELVMGDVNQQPTTVAERAAFLLKDNRLPPLGFTTTHPSYDTAKVSNDARSDSDFNKLNLQEGTGKDIVHFHIPVAGLSGSLKASVKIYYQAVPPKWLNEMFSFTSADIDSFRTMVGQADKLPVCIGGDSLGNIVLGKNPSYLNKQTQLIIWPTLTNGTVFIKSVKASSIKNIEVYTADGRNVWIAKNEIENNFISIEIPAIPGIYFIRIQTENQFFLEKVYRQ
jgi:Zn-finger protein